MTLHYRHQRPAALQPQAADRSNVGEFAGWVWWALRSEGVEILDGGVVFVSVGRERG
eukprot:CAMPEP_0205913394 /NCGR_PEP_ID=MMETSP1325-20131115/6504_1 /ASSEMBLY_ACC=CAM_ASM_000708 /TAXON_ID=236786 /ORGANISM="Florenciella sp., Strain RCC1007" /LENGTH=56 /DNA_ID=CAMNT_0053280249 /DNA_START=8 /DNA_END=178 /DNA_ORIENTATION=+